MRQLNLERSKSSRVPTPSDTTVDLIVAEIARMDAMYVSAGDASKAIEKACQSLEAVPIIEPMVARFYTKQLTLGGKLTTLPKGRAVAEFAKEQGWAKKYFVNVVNEKYLVKVDKDPMAALERSGLLSLQKRKSDDDYVVETRSRPGYLETTQPLPFEVFEVHFEPINHPSLKSFILYIGIVHSLMDVVVLSAIVRLSEKGWTERKPELADIQWKFKNYSWKDVVGEPDQIWNEALSNGEEVMKSYLEGLLPKKEESSADGCESGDDTNLTPAKT